MSRSPQNVDLNGKPDPNGNYVMVKLYSGTLMANQTLLNKAFSSAQPTEFSTTTAGYLSVTAVNPLLNGTGLYKGISGSVTLTGTFAFVIPKYASGKDKGPCNLSNTAQPLAQIQSVTGSGHISFG
jgi:hypothetical protein